MIEFGHLASVAGIVPALVPLMALACISVLVLPPARLPWSPTRPWEPIGPRSATVPRCAWPSTAPAPTIASS